MPNDAINVIYDLALLFGSIGACVIVAALICNVRGAAAIDLPGKRLGHLDGLRGYLALFAVAHHFAATYYWKHTGIWEPPPQAFLTNLGQASLGLFFMITSFLFIRRLMTVRGTMDWKRLYLARIFRIVPLYFSIVTVIFLVVAISTHWELRVTIGILIYQLIRWIMFVGSKINGFTDTRLIIAGVDWSLVYEWIFYALLPLIFVVIRNKATIVCVAVIVVALSIHPFVFSCLPGSKLDSGFLIFFLIGGVAAKLSLNERIPKQLLSHPLMGVFALTCLCTEVVLFRKAYGPLQALLLSGFFIPIVLGNSLFGILDKRPSILLGEISYSIYLLHGFVLYLSFTLLAPDYANAVSFRRFQLWSPVIDVVVVCLSWLTFNFVEQRGIALGQRLLRHLKDETKRSDPTFAEARISRPNQL